MTDAIVSDDSNEASRAHRRDYIEKTSLDAVIGQALRFLRVTLEDLPERGRVNRRTARIQLSAVVRDLELVLEVHAHAAKRELRETVLTALGPGLTVSGVSGARKALQLVLDCLLEIEGEAA